MSTLLLMRHAKSDWDADYGIDHERPLNERGRRCARLMGRLLRGVDLAPDYALGSTAVRARTTLDLAAAAGDWEAPTRLEPALYGGGVATVLSVAANSPPVEKLMLVGHQPTWSTLLHHLTGVRVDMKTASVAVIELPADEWSELPKVNGTLADLFHPRDFYGSEWDDLPGSVP